MLNALGNAARLREILHSYECDLGVNDLSQNEKDVLYTFRMVHDESGPHPIASEKVKSHPFLRDMKHATFYRSVRQLVATGYLGHSAHGVYCFTERVTGEAEVGRLSA